MIRKRINSVIGLVLCFAIISTMFVAVQIKVKAAEDFKTEINEAYDWLSNQKVPSGNAFEGLVDSFEDYWSDGSKVKKEYTYDQAVASIAFLLVGDTNSAKALLDKLSDTQDEGGFWINSYWWDTGAGEEIRRHVGPVMWVCLAVMNYEKITGDTSTYHQMAIDAIDWCLKFQKPNGALSGGETTWDSSDGSWTEEVWSSTEQNIDAYAVLKYFAQTTSSKKTVYTSAADKIKNFLDFVVWDSSKNRWYGGFKNNTNTIDYNVPMDVNPWGVLALGATGTHNYQESISYVENAKGNPGNLQNPCYKNTLPYGGTTITAYDFDWQNDGTAASSGSGGGSLGADIWFEGSAFMACAYSMLGDEVKSDYIIGELAKKQGKDGSMKGGLPYCLNGTNNNYWLMAKENCISSTGWFIIAAKKWNPFTGESTNGKSEGSPSSDLPQNTLPSSDSTENISNNWINELGFGSISTTPVINAGWAENDAPATIYKTENIKGAVQTNDWLSSVLWVPFSESLYAHPLAYKFTKSGLKVSMPKTQYSKDIDGDVEVIRKLDENVPGTIDFTVSSDNFNPADARVDKFSDWSADVVMADGAKNIIATIAHGSPYTYFNFTGCNPNISFNSIPEITQKGNTLIVKANGNYYGFFAPTGSTWSEIGTGSITCNLPAGKRYFSLALLPSKDAFEYYKERAYAFIVNTEVQWDYYDEDSSVVTNYKFTTEAKEGTNRDTIFALYPHQWRDNTFISPMSYTYESIRGLMKTVSGQGFQTKYTYNGMLPNMPGLDSSDTAGIEKLKRMVDDFESNKIAFTVENSGFDTYWTGKTLNELSQVLPIAEQVGDTVASEKIIAAIKVKLEDFFTAESNEKVFYDSNEKNNLFYYNNNWGALIGYDASYGSQNELNDHHFHYGYFIYAASQIALRDREWAKESNWGTMVKLLIKDIANCNRKDSRFPFLRNFDPYAGHSWASGHAKFVDGNNQESSSEAINAWAGIIQWGEATGDSTLRDLGIYLYTTEIKALNNYWFDIYGDTRDSQYVNVDTSMIWGSKNVHTTWWTNDPIQVHGINWLPITGASLYLGTDPEYVKKNYDSVWREWDNWLKIRPGDQNGDLKLWHDIMCSYYALYDPQEAISKWDEKAAPESGESTVHTYHWLHSLKTVGVPDFTVTSDTTLYSVFKNKSDNKKTYVVYNVSDQEKQVNFSDGMKFIAKSKSMTVVKEGEYTNFPTIKYGDVSGDGNINSIDYALMRSYLLGIINFFPVENEIIVSDINGDGNFNSLDFAFLRSYLLGMIKYFPIENK